MGFLFPGRFQAPALAEAATTSLPIGVWKQFWKLTPEVATALIREGLSAGL
jgi:hypothetical protein